MAVDQKAGLLWVTNGSGDTINVYKVGSTSPIETITGHGFPYQVSVQNAGKPTGTTIYSDEGDDSLYAFKKGKYTPYATLTNGTGEPTGALITRP